MPNPSPHLLTAAEIEARSGSFSHPWNPRSLIRGAQLGRMLGLQRAGVNLSRIPPGKESFVYHSHRFEEEWLYVLSGRGMAEIEGEAHEIGPGDFLGFPTGVAHHLRNPFGEELVYLCGSRPLEIGTYPELGKVMIRDGEKIQIFDAASARPFGPL